MVSFIACKRQLMKSYIVKAGVSPCKATFISFMYKDNPVNCTLRIQLRYLYSGCYCLEFITTEQLRARM
jgi:hypothetical protein